MNKTLFQLFQRHHKFITPKCHALTCLLENVWCYSLDIVFVWQSVLHLEITIIQVKQDYFKSIIPKVAGQYLVEFVPVLNWQNTQYGMCAVVDSCFNVKRIRVFFHPATALGREHWSCERATMWIFDDLNIVVHGSQKALLLTLLITCTIMGDEEVL